MPYQYDYPHPAVTVDIVVFTIENDDLKVLLVERGQEPFRDRWALPGGFVEIDESLRRAAWRELKEETGVHAGFLEQLYAFGRPDRDPRERVITVAYYALIPPDRMQVVAGSDASAAELVSVAKLPDLAFDHERIINKALQGVREKLIDPVIALQLLPETFTMSELRRVYELFRGEELDKRNFTKKMIALDHVEETGEKRTSVNHRPARLYRVKDSKDVPYR
jgi:8-oxo-dGTP diphosphatase